MFFRFFLHVFMYNYTHFGTFAEKMKPILYIMSKGTPKSPFFLLYDISETAVPFALDFSVKRRVRRLRIWQKEETADTEGQHQPIRHLILRPQEMQ